MAIPPALADRCVDVTADGSRHTQPTVFAITTTDSRARSRWPQIDLHDDAESFGMLTPEAPTAAVGVGQPAIHNSVNTSSDLIPSSLSDRRLEPLEISSSIRASPENLTAAAYAIGL